MGTPASTGPVAFTGPGPDSTAPHKETASAVATSVPYGTESDDTKCLDAQPDWFDSSKHCSMSKGERLTSTMSICRGCEPRAVPVELWGDWHELAKLNGIIPSSTYPEPAEALLDSSLLLQQPAPLDPDTYDQQDFLYPTPQCSSCGNDIRDLRRIHSHDPTCALTRTSTRSSDNFAATPYSWRAGANMPMLTSGYPSWPSQSTTAHEPAVSGQHMFQSQEELRLGELLLQYNHGAEAELQPYEELNNDSLSHKCRPLSTQTGDSFRPGTSYQETDLDGLVDDTWNNFSLPSSTYPMYKGAHSKDLTPSTSHKAFYPVPDQHSDPFFVNQELSTAMLPLTAFEQDELLFNNNQTPVLQTLAPLTQFPSGGIQSAQDLSGFQRRDVRAITAPRIQTPESLSTQDQLLLSYRDEGMSYKQIKAICGFAEAESTLRGRHRNLTKHRKDRLRKPKWTARDISILQHTVAQYLPMVPPGDGLRSTAGFHRANKRLRLEDLNKVSWKHVAEEMKKFGCYQYGNATVKKKYLEVTGIKMTEPSL